MADQENPNQVSEEEGEEESEEESEGKRDVTLPMKSLCNTTYSFSFTEADNDKVEEDAEPKPGFSFSKVLPY